MVHNKKNNSSPDKIVGNSICSIRMCFIKGVVLSTFFYAAPASSEQVAGQKIQFDMPSSDLASALNSFAEKTSIDLTYPAYIVLNEKSKPVKGHYSIQDGLKELLRGTGVVYRLTGDNSITLAKETVSEPQSSKTMEVITVTGKAVHDASNPYNKEYAVSHASAATKTDTPIMETPVSIQVLPRAVMDDQKSSRVADALENISGVRPQSSLGSGDGFIVRGFRTGNIYRNGVLSNEGGFGSFDTGNLESIEVLKGPAQLYGRTEPGGLININTKKPLDTPYYSLEQRFGSYDLYRTQWDATGPVTADKTLLYRFTGAYQDNKSFRDFVTSDRILINPSITWRPTDALDVTVDVEGTNKNAIADFGIPVIGNRPAAIPISRNLGDPNTPLSEQSSVKIGSEINYRFNDNWAIHNRFLASLADGNTTQVNPAPAFNDAVALNQVTGMMSRNVYRQTSSREVYSTNLDITGKFDIGETKHEVLGGFDFYRAFDKYNVDGRWKIPDPALAINIYNPYPSYGIPQSTFDTALSTSDYFAGVTGNNHAVMYNSWYGAYFQDQITIWDRLHIMGGGRYDWAETGRANASNFADAENQLENLVRADGALIRKDEGFSPRVGILYQPWQQLSVYGSWTTSFGANNANSADGRTFDPQTSEQFEAGIKTQLFDQRLLATLAYYHLTKDNILVNDLSTPDPFDKIANQQRSQGIELDMTGRVTEALSLIGSYAFTDARVIKDFGGNTAGNRLSNVPEHSGSMWLKYDLNGYGALNGLSFGLGGVAVGRREGDNANSFQMPGYVRMDTFAAYRWDTKSARVTTQLSVRNLLDKQYYASTDPTDSAANVAPRLGVYPGEPLTVVGSLRVEF